MRVLIVGSGGREHALAWKCAASARVEEVLVAPGNAGTATEPKVRNVAVPADDIAALARLARDARIDLTIVNAGRVAASTASSSSRAVALGLLRGRQDLSFRPSGPSAR